MSAFTSRCGNPPVFDVKPAGIILCKIINTLPSFNEDDKNTEIFLVDLCRYNRIIYFRSWTILEMIVIRKSMYLCNITTEAENVLLDSSCFNHPMHGNILKGELLH